MFNKKSDDRNQRPELAFIDRLKIYNEETIVFRFEILHSLRSFRMTGVVEDGERKPESKIRRQSSGSDERRPEISK